MYAPPLNAVAATRTQGNEWSEGSLSDDEWSALGRPPPPQASGLGVGTTASIDAIHTDPPALIVSRVLDNVRVRLTEGDLASNVNRESFIDIVSRRAKDPLNDEALTALADVYDRAAVCSTVLPESDVAVLQAPAAPSTLASSFGSRSRAAQAERLALSRQNTSLQFQSRSSEAAGDTSLGQGSLPPNVTGSEIRENSITYRELLDAFNPGFPTTSVEQRNVIDAAVAKGEDAHVVMRRDVDEQLQGDRGLLQASIRGQPHKDEAEIGTITKHARKLLLDSIFGPTAQSVPALVLRETAGALAARPKRQDFARVCARELFESTRRLSTVVPVVALMLLALITTAAIGIDECYGTYQAAFYRPADDWPNFCPTADDNRGNWDPANPNPTSAGAASDKCWLGDARFLFQMKRTDHVEWYVREHLIKYALWGDLAANQTRAQKPIMGSWPIGAVIARTSPIVTSAGYDREDERCPRVPCADLGLGANIFEFQVSQSFSCDAFASSNLTVIGGNPRNLEPFTGEVDKTPLVVIPFSATRPEAQALAETFGADYCEEEDAMTVVQFATYQPEAKIVTWVSVTMTVPKPGHVIPRLTITPIKGDAARVALGIMIAQIIVLVFRLINSAVLAHDLDVPLKPRVDAVLSFENIVSTVQSLFLIVGYAYLRRAQLAVDDIDLENVSTVPQGIDVAASDFDAGMDLLAAWFFTFFALSSRYFRDFLGVGLVVSLLSVALADIVALLFSFGSITCAFVAVARVLFGGRDAIFAYTSTAFVAIISVFWGDADFENLTEQNPRLGTLYYLALVAFVNFFALNLIIAVMTNPLKTVVEEANLHVEVFDGMLTTATMSPTLRRWFPLWKAGLIFANVPVWGWPPLKAVRFTRHCASRIEEIYDRQVSLPRVIYAAQRLLHDLYDPSVRLCVEGPLSKAVNQQERIPLSSPSSGGFALITRVLRVGSSSAFSSDARLLSVLVNFDRYDTSNQDLMTRMKSGRDAFDARARRIQIMAIELQQKMQRREAVERLATEQRQQHAQAGLASPRASTGSGRNGAGRGATLHTSSVNQRMSASTQQRPADRQPPRRAAALDDRSSTAIAHKHIFFLSRYVQRKVNRKLIIPLESFMVCFLCSLFMTLVLEHRDVSAWLGENLHDALRDSPYRQYCADERCANYSLTHEKHFLDIKHIGEIPEFVDRLLADRLFGGNESDTPWKFRPDDGTNASFAVGWDPYVRRTTPIRVRQLRAEPAPCAFSTFRQRAGSSGEVCYATHGKYAADPILRTPAASQPVYHAVAFTQDCSAGTRVWGVLDEYPCQGHVVDLYTEAELRGLYEWIDESTRLLELSFSVKSTYTNFSDSASERNTDLALRYDMYVEFSQGGAGGRSWAWVSPAETELSQFYPIMYVLLGFDAAVWCARFYWVTSVARRYKMRLKAPRPPLLLLLTCATVFIIMVTPLPPYESQTYRAPFLIGYATLRFLKHLVEPAVQLLSARAIQIRRLLALSVSSVTMVLPFYAVFFVAYAYTGYLLFGRELEQFSDLRHSSLTVARSFVAELDFQVLYQKRPVAAVLYTLAFFAVVIVVLANILLTLVTAASDESKKELIPIKFIEDVSRKTDFPLYSGAWFEAWVAYRLRLRAYQERREAEKSERLGARGPVERVAEQLAKDDEPSAATIVDSGRLPLPVESLILAGFTSFRLIEASALLDTDKLPIHLRYSAVLFLARLALRFERTSGDKNAADDVTEARLQLEYGCVSDVNLQDLATSGPQPPLPTPSSPTFQPAHRDAGQHPPPSAMRRREHPYRHNSAGSGDAASPDSRRQDGRGEAPLFATGRQVTLESTSLAPASRQHSRVVDGDDLASFLLPPEPRDGNPAESDATEPTSIPMRTSPLQGLSRQRSTSSAGSPPSLGGRRRLSRIRRPTLTLSDEWDEDDFASLGPTAPTPSYVRRFHI